MRVFIVLALAALAHADVGGYNYGGPAGGGASLSQPIEGSSGGPGFDGGAGDFGGAPAPVAAGPVEVQKEFYTYTAPEGEFDDHRGLDDINSSAKKNLRVIFIRGPENNGLQQAALNLAKSANDDRTAIYILQKQADLSNLAQQLQNVNQQHSNRPEVHFVKYRTPEDAAHAQHAIQQQYNNLGGTTHSHDGGVAPVLNFASRAPAAAPAPAQGGGSYGQAPANTYIPPAPAPQAPSGTYLPIVKV